MKRSVAIAAVPLVACGARTELGGVITKSGGATSPPPRMAAAMASVE